jgi:hypothetical protein
MIALVGTYQNGVVKFDKEYASDTPIRVIVTFLEDIETQTDEGLSVSDFSFLESQKNLEHYSGSFADAVIEERCHEDIN